MKGSPSKALLYASMLSSRSFFSSFLPKLEMAVFIARSTFVASSKNWIMSVGVSCSWSFCFKYLLTASKALRRSSKRPFRSSSSYAATPSCKGDFPVFMISVIGKSSYYKEGLIKIQVNLSCGHEITSSQQRYCIFRVFGWIIRTCTCIPFFPLCQDVNSWQARFMRIKKKYVQKIISIAIKRILNIKSN